MMKSVEELISIKFLYSHVYGTCAFETRTGKKVKEKKVKVLKEPPILVSTRDDHAFSYYRCGEPRIPEKANALLIGESIKAEPDEPIKYYAASYCRIP